MYFLLQAEIEQLYRRKKKVHVSEAAQTTSTSISTIHSKSHFKSNFMRHIITLSCSYGRNMQQISALLVGTESMIGKFCIQPEYVELKLTHLWMVVGGVFLLLHFGRRHWLVFLSILCSAFQVHPNFQVLFITKIKYSMILIVPYSEDV